MSVYERWREEVPADSLEAYDAALRELRELPHDGTDFDVPVPPDPKDSVPRPPAQPPPPRSVAADPALAAAGERSVEDLVQSGALVEYLHDKPPVVYHRLNAIAKSDGGVRLIADLRQSNELQDDVPTFALPSFLDAARVRGARFAAKLDLKSAFYSVRVGEHAQRHFATVLSDGRQVCWRGMPMGWHWAPRVFSTILGPLRVLLAARGVALFNYLDDFLVVGPTAAVVERHLDELAERLHHLHFVVSAKKTSCTATRSLVFLGMGLDLTDKSFWWPPEKADKVAAEARFLAGARGRVPLVALQRFLGRLAFLCVVCPLAHAWRRALDAAVAAARDQPYVPLDPAARAELQFWTEPARGLAGLTFPFPGEAEYRVVLRTDASDYGGGVRIQWPNGEWRTLSVLLPRWLTSASSTARELYVTYLGLRIVGAGCWPTHRMRIDCYTDSTCSAAALGGRARAVLPVTLSREVLAWSRESGAIIDAHWLRRDLLAAEDAASREAHRSHCQLDPCLVGALVELAAGPAALIGVDAFATAANALAGRFCALLPEPEAATVDGLRAPLDTLAAGGVVWAFPPFGLAAAAARVLARGTSVAILVAPADTPTAPGSPVVVPLLTHRILRRPPDYSSLHPSPRPLAAYIYRSSLPQRVRYEVGPLPCPSSPVVLAVRPYGSLRQVLTASEGAVGPRVACVSLSDIACVRPWLGAPCVPDGLTWRLVA